LNEELDLSLSRFFDGFQAHNPEPRTQWDAEWPSPCELGTPFSKPSSTEQLIQWRPVARRHAEADFAGLENSLEYEVHPDIKTYFGKYWADNISVQAPDGPCDLLFIWSPKDLDRLIENLIGHAFACQVNKTPFSIFFACTQEPDDYYLTVNNDTGVVQLETPAKPPIREVAPDLTTFLDTLSFTDNPRTLA
jgi:SecY interacting protein Syd